ncbi:MAG TPA: sugar isomerase [Phycisphaerae bacterium]|nr:sugar isomerase [Phycisphaerae bacterium]HNU46518.1 sugar isomerase [Phycisphaerae bacterium]
MTESTASHSGGFRPHCCPRPHQGGQAAAGLSRREFIGTGSLAVGAVALHGLSWSALASSAEELPAPPARRPLRVKPILAYGIPQRQPQTSWRSWGGLQTEKDVAGEVARIGAELDALSRAADFPVGILPVGKVQSAEEVAQLADLSAADALLVYAAGGWMDIFDALGRTGKPMIFFVRHRSGPVYLWYEIITPRYLRQHTDELQLEHVHFQDVVVDSQEELCWRLRALCGLQNTVGSRIVAVGGPSAWSQPPGVVPNLVQQRWGLDIRTVSYDELGRLIETARGDEAAVERARRRATEYLRLPGTALETERAFVDNAFLLEEILRRLMQQADCGALTINDCMSTIMPKAQTTACLTLSLLNDAGYLAFCESDFVVIPSGLLLAGVAGKPVFLQDPTYPHDGLITLAHCTAPRRMDGKTPEPARILTHFESDYGAAPKVEMRNGQAVTMIVPDFKAERWVGLKGTIEDNPFLDICRSQIDVRYTCADALLAERMPGFHWMLAYGDYRRELGYALRRVGIAWEQLA